MSFFQSALATPGLLAQLLTGMLIVIVAAFLRLSKNDSAVDYANRIASVGVVLILTSLLMSTVALWNKQHKQPVEPPAIHKTISTTEVLKA